MVFHWSLNDSKFHQVSTTLLSILGDLNRAIVWMISIRPPIFNSSSPLWGLFQVHQLKLVLPLLSCFMAFLVLWHDPCICRSFHFLLFLLCDSQGRQSPLYSRYFLLIIIWPGHPFASQNPREYYEFLSPRRILVYLVVWLHLNFLYNSQWITLPTQSFLVLYSLSATLLQLLFMGFMVSSQSQNNKQLIFCCI